VIVLPESFDKVIGSLGIYKPPLIRKGEMDPPRPKGFFCGRSRELGAGGIGSANR